ncbi:hypothetical protein N7533_005149 [Penicillium manginii]|uniref:uncharacterized protein n=1 Tax=Penicillium manginii TaxID=203109 RepID=UPI0025471D21|nr:uncharacterized protein N7533_005149 [Penicillium manginii]KAJ5755606.1 hypothetical protein N7533_005149 [Penicillium manginii]
MKMDFLCCDTTASQGLKSTADAEARSALQRHREIEAYLASEKERSNKIKRTALLGIRGSGKSTVMKQLHYIHSNGFSEEERRKARSVILISLLRNFKDLLRNMDDEGITFDTEIAKISADLIAETDADMDVNVHALFNGSPVDAAICEAMKNVRHDPAIPLKILLSFYNATDRLTAPTWLPNEQDIIQAQIGSLRIAEISFHMDLITWEMINIANFGMQGRRKQLHHFEDVDCVIYVVPLSDYDRRVVEDDTSTVMHEIIIEFESSTYYNRWFKNKPFIILLNKVDVFKEKLAVSPLSRYFPDFDGSNTDFSAAAGYFANRFRALATARAGGRQVRTYFTNATDTASIKATMEAIHSSIF